MYESSAKEFSKQNENGEQKGESLEAQTLSQYVWEFVNIVFLSRVEFMQQHT